MHVLPVQRLQALGMATNKMGYERTAYLALAATAVPCGSEPIEAQTCANWSCRPRKRCRVALVVQRALLLLVLVRRAVCAPSRDNVHSTYESLPTVCNVEFFVSHSWSCAPWMKALILSHVACLITEHFLAGGFSVSLFHPQSMILRDGLSFCSRGLLKHQPDWPFVGLRLGLECGWRLNVDGSTWFWPQLSEWLELTRLNACLDLFAGQLNRQIPFPA